MDGTTVSARQCRRRHMSTKQETNGVYIPRHRTPRLTATSSRVHYTEKWNEKLVRNTRTLRMTVWLFSCILRQLHRHHQLGAARTQAGDSVRLPNVGFLERIKSFPLLALQNLEAAFFLLIPQIYFRKRLVQKKRLGSKRRTSASSTP